MTPSQLASLPNTQTFRHDLTIARGERFVHELLIEGWDLKGETLVATFRRHHNDPALLASFTAVVSATSRPTFDELIAEHPGFKMPEGALGTDQAFLSLVNLSMTETITAALPTSKLALGANLTGVWDLYAVTTMKQRLFSGQCILSEGSSYD